jgi:hypothetical protein
LWLFRIPHSFSSQRQLDFKLSLVCYLQSSVFNDKGITL